MYALIHFKMLKGKSRRIYSQSLVVTMKYRNKEKGRCLFTFYFEIKNKLPI